MQIDATVDRQKRRLSNSLLVMLFSYAIGNSMMSVLMSEVIDEFQLHGVQEGLMSSLINLGCMLALLLTPFMQGRVRKTSMILFAGLLMTGMMVATGAAHALPLLLGAGLLLGVGSGFSDGYINSTMVDVHGPDNAKHMGVLHGCFGVGSLLTPLVITALLGYVSWREVYFILAGVCLLCAAAFFYSSRRNAGILQQGGRQETKLTGAAVRAYMQRPRNMLLIAAALFYSVTQAGLAMWAVRYYTVQFHNSALGATTVSVFWVCATISRFLAPRVRMQPLRLFLWGCVGAAVTMAIGVLSNNAIFMLVMAGANGLLSGACVPLLLSEGTVGYEGSTSLPTSVLLLFTNLGRTLMPLMMGGLTAAVSVQAAMLVPAFTALLAATAAGFAGRKQER